MSDCYRCREALDPEDGRWRVLMVKRRRLDVHLCLRCADHVDRIAAFKAARRPPPSRIVNDRRVYDAGRLPTDNPAAWLERFGIVGNVWAAWCLGRGLLDELFEREVTLDEAGDDESRAIARRILGIT